MTINDYFAVQVHASKYEELPFYERRENIYFARNLRYAIKLAKLAINDVTKSLKDRELNTSIHITIGKPDCAIFDKYSDNSYWYRKYLFLRKNIELYALNGEIIKVYSCNEISPKEMRIISALIERFNKEGK